jgi:Prion-inhibition and propagation
MAEIVGTVVSIITLASLLKLCVEAFDLIQAGRRQEFDLKKLKLRLDVEKYRLLVWGEAMGLMKPKSDIEFALLSPCPFQDVVKDILQMMVSLFNDTHKIEKRYVCKRTLVSKLDENLFLVSGEQRPIDHLAVCFRQVENVPHSSRRTTLYQKTRWTIYDRDKFNDLILEVKDFIDGLQDLTQHLSTKAR